MTSMLNTTLSTARHHYNVVIRDLDVLAENDGYAEWRQNESKALSSIVQNRLKALQNPKDCSSARKLVCNLNKGCGYGCQVISIIFSISDNERGVPRIAIFFDSSKFYPYVARG